MFGEIIISIAKYILISSILLLLYTTLFRDKASFITRRIYLLSIPIIALFAASVSIEMLEINNDHPIGQVSGMVESASDVLNEVPTQFVVEQGGEVPIYYTSTPGFQISRLILWAWIAVAALLLCRMIKSLISIHALRRVSNAEPMDGESVTLYRCGLVEAPFSFLRSIYLDNETQGEHLDLILKHEMAHISRHHSAERILAEIYIIVSWFNPVVYAIARELEAVHEYEADSQVVRSCDRREYKQLLFDQVTRNSPALTNGLNNSLIKKRFIQMKNNYQIRGRFWRNTLTLPTIVLLLTLTSLTYVNGKDAAEAIDAKVEGKTEAQSSEEKPNYYDLSKGEYSLAKEEDYKKMSVYRYDTHTEVDYMLKVLWNFHWTAFLTNAFLVDPKTGDRYQIHSLKGGAPLNRPLVFRNEKDNITVMTAIFPPLKEGVTTVHYMEQDSPGYIPGGNASKSHEFYKDIKVERRK